MMSILGEATHWSDSDLFATHFLGLFMRVTPHITAIASRALWASDFPSACQGRAEQERALWYRNLHFVKSMLDQTHLLLTS